MQCVANCNKLIGTRDGQSVCPFTQSRVCNIYTVIFSALHKTPFYYIHNRGQLLASCCPDYIFFFLSLRYAEKQPLNGTTFCVFAVHKSTLSFSYVLIIHDETLTSRIIANKVATATLTWRNSLLLIMLTQTERRGDTRQSWKVLERPMSLFYFDRIMDEASAKYDLTKTQSKLCQEYQAGGFVKTALRSQLYY